MIIVGKPPVDPDAARPKGTPHEKKFKPQIICDTAQAEAGKKQEEEESSPSLNREAYMGPQIIITEDPPTIQKIRKLFSEKGRKIFYLRAVCSIY